MNNILNQPILVAGASGNLGRLVVSELLDTWHVPADQIIATTRNPESLAEFAELGVVVREADVNEPETLVKAFAGAKRMLIISMPAAAPYRAGERFSKHKVLIEAAIEAGVEHIMYTSAPYSEPGTPCYVHFDHYNTEQFLINSGVNWTILRHWEWPEIHFTDNWMLGVINGEYYSCAGRGGMNLITRADCAKADAGALVSDVSVNRRFDITGTAPQTADQIMSMLSEISGKEIKVVHVTPEELPEYLSKNGTHPMFIPPLVSIGRGIRQGFYGGSTDAVEELTGSKPESLRDYLYSQADIIRAGQSVSIFGDFASVDDEAMKDSVEKEAMPRDHEQEEQNKQIVSTYTQDLFNNHDISAVDRVVDAGVVQHGVDIEDGALALKSFVIGEFQRYPELSLVVQHVAADGDSVFVHSCVKKDIDDKGDANVDIYRLHEGLIVEHWNVAQS